jgi:hypothetical protein
MELPCSTVERVRTRLCHNADLTAGGVAVLGREIVGLDPNLLNGVWRWRIEARRLIEVGEDRAVQREQVMVRVAAVHRHDRTLAAIRRVLIRANRRDAGVRAASATTLRPFIGRSCTRWSSIRFDCVAVRDSTIVDCPIR